MLIKNSQNTPQIDKLNRVNVFYSLFSSKRVNTTSMTWSLSSTKATVLATCLKVSVIKKSSFVFSCTRHNDIFTSAKNAE